MDDQHDDQESVAALPPRSSGRKKESTLGNILEAVFTYGVSFFVCLPVNWIIIFGPWEFSTPEAQMIFWPAWLFFMLLVDFGNRVAANTGIQAKFANKTMRLFADFLSSLSPLVLVLFMIVLGMLSMYVPSRTDVMVAILMTMFCINDLYGNSNIVHTALRRVTDVSRDR